MKKKLKQLGNNTVSNVLGVDETILRMIDNINVRINNNIYNVRGYLRSKKEIIFVEKFIMGQEVPIDTYTDEDLFEIVEITCQETLDNEIFKPEFWNVLRNLIYYDNETIPDINIINSSHHILAAQCRIAILKFKREIKIYKTIYWLTEMFCRGIATIHGVPAHNLLKGYYTIYKKGESSEHCSQRVRSYIRCILYMMRFSMYPSSSNVEYCCDDIDITAKEVGWTENIDILYDKNFNLTNDKFIVSHRKIPVKGVKDNKIFKSASTIYQESFQNLLCQSLGYPYYFCDDAHKKLKFINHPIPYSYYKSTLALLNCDKAIYIDIVTKPSVDSDRLKAITKKSSSVLIQASKEGIKSFHILICGGSEYTFSNDPTLHKIVSKALMETMRKKCNRNGCNALILKSHKYCHMCGKLQ